MWRNGSVRFRLIPIDGTYKGKMVRTEVMSCPPGGQRRPPGMCYSVRNVFFCTYLFQNSLLYNNVLIVLVPNLVR